MMKDVHCKLQDMNKDLDRWKQVSKVPAALEKALDSVPEGYRSRVRELANKEADLASEDYKEVLAAYQQRHDQPDTRTRFERTCNWLEAWPSKLKAACEQQIEQRVKILDERWNTFRDFIFMTQDFKKLAPENTKNPQSEIGKLRKSYVEARQQYRKAWQKQKTDPKLKPDGWRQKLDEYLTIFDKLDAEMQKMSQRGKVGDDTSKLLVFPKESFEEWLNVHHPYHQFHATLSNIQKKLALQHLPEEINEKFVDTYKNLSKTIEDYYYSSLDINKNKKHKVIFERFNKIISKMEKDLDR